MPEVTGFTIHAIVLSSCQFRIVRDELMSGVKEAGPRQLEYEMAPVPEPNDAQGRLRHSLRVTVRGLADGARVWEAEASYRAIFSVAVGTEVQEAQARTIHVPAMLWVFARELIADLTRRAAVGLVYLPPMRFASLPAEAASPTSPERA